MRTTGRRGGGLGTSVLTVPPQLADIAGAVGTPVYVYDAGSVRTRYAQLTHALSGIPHRIHYSVKANSNLAILALTRSLGAGADIVSGGELARARAAGFDPASIVFSGVGKSRAELEAAASAGLGLVNVESAGELDALGDVAAATGTSVRVGIRVNPDVTTETHPYTQTGVRSVKFGVPLDEVVPLALRCASLSGVTLRAIGMHLGSQITDPEPYRVGAARLADLIGAVRAAGIDTVEIMDIGGGFGVALGPGGAELDLDALAAAVGPIVAATGVTLYVEPGRFLVAHAGHLVTRVLYRKHAGGREIVVVDAGMSDLVRPSLYAAEHAVSVVVPGHDAGERAPVDIVGPICESGDFLAMDRDLAGATPGALLAVHGTGAYGFTMSSNYNSRPRPPEVLLDGPRWGIVRGRETAEDLYRAETPNPTWQ